MTTYDYRALCVALTDCLEKADWPLRHRYVFRQWIDIARAALADEPAVPQGREPAAVTKQPSDEEIIAFWSDHCAGDGDAGIIRLARWGTSNLTQTWLSPADGEVAECAAELLQRQALPEVGE